MNSLMRLGLVLLAFAAIVWLIPLIDSSPDDAAGPIAAAMGIAGLALVAVGVSRKPS